MSQNCTPSAGFVRSALSATLVLAQVFGLSCSSSQPKSPPEAEALSEMPAHYEITPENLPRPYATPHAVNPPRIVPQPQNARLHLPRGFQIETFAEGGLEKARWLALAPNGDIFVSEGEAGVISVRRDSNSDGQADARFVFAENLMQPFGMAFWNEFFYVALTNALIRFRYQPGQTRASGPPERVADLPGRGYREHWTRNLIFSPDGTRMYVTVGSETNVAVEGDPLRAAISEFNPDGTGHRVYASGLRNPTGLAFQPGTSTVWAAVNERDGLGDDLVPDYVTSVRFGGFYGWPYSYIGQNLDPRRVADSLEMADPKSERPDRVEKALLPDVLIQAHSAPLGLVFYEGMMFPEEYRGSAFVALHGSWNRSKRTGYKIIRIRFKNGTPVGGYEDFITGWMIDEDSPEVWGRPVCLLILKDGSMLISDDGAHKIWRVTFKDEKTINEKR